MLRFAKPLWAYRSFILGSVKREFQTKYKASILGAAWAVLNPLAMILVYTIVFSQVMQAKLPGVTSAYGYSIYLCAGVLTWGLFAEIVGRGQTVFLDNANLLKKLNFPRLCLPLIIVTGALINFLIVFFLFVLFLLITGSFPGMVFISVIPLIALLVLFSIGLGVSLGVLNVFFRDVGQFFGIFISFWFWLTPIVYTINIMPEAIVDWVAFNPMVPVMQSFQKVISAGQWPDWQALIYPAVLATLLCALGFRLFRKHAGEMVDEL
jgi:lipopolysaccharide transport system permease protein